MLGVRAFVHTALQTISVRVWWANQSVPCFDGGGMPTCFAVEAHPSGRQPIRRQDPKERIGEVKEGWCEEN